MNYINLRKGLASKAKLIPINADIYEHITDNETDWYMSLFQYNDKHKEILKTSGTLAGIKDVKTDIIFFDFDDKDNINNAKEDAITLCKRLKDKGIENFNICFSGMKGFSVDFYTKELFTPREFKQIITGLAGDLKTFDVKVCDPQRVVRVPNTKHQKSGLYKVPITFEELSSLTIEEITSNAIKPNFEAYKPIYIECPDTLIPVEEVEEHKPIDLGDFDIKNRPAFFDEARWMLNNGIFENGERNTALLCLASFYKSLGYVADQTYRILKGTAELQSKRTNTDRYPDEELYNNIIMSVYGPNWKGGTFSIRDPDSWLYKYAKRQGIDVTSDGVKASKFTDIETDFVDFVKNIEQNTIKTGIKYIDENMLITTGSVMGILGPASSGKCLGKDTPIMMYDGSIKKVQDVVIGDLLMGDDKTPRKVLGTCRGQSELFKVNQEKGDSYIVNDEHILSLKCKIDRKKNGKVIEGSIFRKNKIIDIPIKEYINQTNEFKRYYHGYKVDVEFKENNLILDPYILGYWLGNGTSKKTQFTLHKDDVEIKNKLDEFAKEIGCLSKHNSQSENGCSIDIVTPRGQDNPFLNMLRDIKVFGDKHIPNSYLKNNRTNRLKLLAGLIDSDGYYSSKQKWYELTFKDKTLSDNALYLIRSLGIHASQHKKIAKYKSFTKGKWYMGECVVYRISFGGGNCKDIPILLPRKQYKDAPIRDSLSGRIYVESIGWGDYYGFEIDGNKRFLLGDFTVTHNTSVTLDILNHTSLSGVPSVFASLDMYRTRIYEKLIYRVTDGKYDRKKVYEMYKNGEYKDINQKIKEQFGNVYFYDKSSPTVQDIREYVLEVEKTSGQKVKLVMIDYFERISSDMSDDTAASKRIMGEIQDLMNDLNLCVIVLYQPNKMSIGGGPDVPILNYTAIKGSSFVFQSLRNIVSICRYGQNVKYQDYDKYINFNILKNDLGTLGSCDMHWTGRTGRIRELEDHERTQLKEFLKLKEMDMGDKNKSEWV